MKSVETTFIRNGIELAREEMLENFESQSSKESGQLWPELSYRYEPPTKLDLTGELKNEVATSRPNVSGNKGVLVIDPIDEKGRGYASYHEDGVNQYKDKEEFQREFVTQSSELAEKQVRLLETLINNQFNT